MNLGENPEPCKWNLQTPASAGIMKALLKMSGVTEPREESLRRPYLAIQNKGTVILLSQHYHFSTILTR